MADSVIYVLKSKRTIDMAIESTQLIGITAGDIVKNLEVTQYQSTQIVNLVLHWNNEQEGLRIVNAIIESVPGTLVETLDLGSVNVIEEAESSHAANSLINLKLILIPTIGGLFIAVAIVFLQMLIHPTVDSKEDLRKLDLDYIGIVPYDPSFFEQKHWIKMLQSDDPENLLMADAFEGIAYILDHSLHENHNKVFYITSTVANEGKSVISVNLAGVMSHIGKRVLLVDFDLRKPSIGNLLGIDSDYRHTLNAVFFYQSSIKDAVIHVTDKLDVLVAKVDKKNLYVDDYLIDQVNGIKDDYDVVVIDSGPVGLVSNTMMINRIADEAILVIRYNTVWIDIIKDAVKMLRDSGIKVKQCIINSSEYSSHLGLYTGSYYHNKYDSKTYGNPYSRAYESEKKPTHKKSDKKTGLIKKFFKKKHRTD